MEAVETEVVDDGSKQDRRGRKLAGRERMEALVGEYHRSGLTQAEFARQVGVNYSTFAGWVRNKRLEQAKGPSHSTLARFAEVRMPTTISGEPLSVVLADGVIVRGGDINTLAALVKALRS